MRTIIISILAALTLTTLSTTARADYARDSLPDCQDAEVSIYDGPTFEGTVYLHDVDVQLGKGLVSVVRAVAAQGLTPTVCQQAGSVVVGVAELIGR